MGLYWIAVMHEPIKDSLGAARILNVIRGGDRSYLSTFCVQSDSQFGRSGGFNKKKEKTMEKNNKNQPTLKVISGQEKLVIEALDGKSIIGRNKTLFAAMIDNRFEEWGLNKNSPETPETEVVVCKLQKNATLIEIFAGITLDLEKLVFTQAQVINFCRKYPGWLVKKKFGTFFLIKVGLEYYVVDVCSNADGLMIFSHRLGSDVSWKKGRHIVIPKIA